MPLHHRRTLLSGHPDRGDCNDWGSYGCSSPPSPPPHTLPPIASPSPSPSSLAPPTPSPPCWFSLPFPCPHIPRPAPSPSPVYGPAGGRRDQGQGGNNHGYGPAGGGADDHRRRLVTFILIAAAAIAFLSLILLGVSVAVRRRRLRRRRQALLAPAPAAATNVEDNGWNGDPEGGGGVVHHVWYIRTVGLDEAVIDSIAATRYRAGAELLGAADCSVCLGQFEDGELVRLLPRCGHAFHAPCIDTWLRAHVNCPLCRSDVLDPAATTAGDGIESNSNAPVDPDANAHDAAEQVAVASDSTTEHEDESNDQEAPQVEEDQHEQLSSPEPPPQLPCPLPRNVRRAASMDAAIVSTAADVAASERLPEAAPEGEQSGRQKHRNGAKVSGSGHPINLSTERHPKSFFSRHCRARSSVLPL